MDKTNYQKRMDFNEAVSIIDDLAFDTYGIFDSDRDALETMLFCYFHQQEYLEEILTNILADFDEITMPKDYNRAKLKHEGIEDCRKIVQEYLQKVGGDEDNKVIN